jgi:thioredoxin
MHKPIAPTIRDLTTADFDAGIATGLTVVDFWAPWCGPCRAMVPQLEKAARLRPHYHFAKVNIDEQPALAQRFSVRSIPMLAIFRDGELLGASAGVIRAADLVAALDSVA